MHSILAIDPGKTTGLCFGTLTADKLVVNPTEKRMTGAELFHLLGEFTNPRANRHHVIYERFEYRNIAMKVDLTAVKLIGVIELFREWHDPFIHFYDQSASVQGDKMYYTDKRLKELGIYWPHGAGHARSATKHLMYWLNFGAGGQFVNIEKIPVELEGTPPRREG